MDTGAPFGLCSPQLLRIEGRTGWVPGSEFSVWCAYFAAARERRGNTRNRQPQKNARGKKKRGLRMEDGDDIRRALARSDQSINHKQFRNSEPGMVWH